MKRFTLNSNQGMGEDYRIRDSLHVKIEKPGKLLGGVLTGHLPQDRKCTSDQVLRASAFPLQ